MQVLDSQPKPPTPVDRAATASISADLLQGLGERVRDWRARRGMTRKILARDSAVSERYLAQLEAGRGNISVLLLQQIARALNVPVSELLREETDEAPELQSMLEVLRRMPPQQLTRLHARLRRRVGQAEVKRKQRIALIGLRGAGKSTLGVRLARSLAAPFLELDREIEHEAGTSLSEIFLLYGQGVYRRHERRCLESVVKQHERMVLATGGSIVSEPATYDLLLATCYTVWLKAEPADHMARVVAQGDVRPMAGNEEAMDDLRRILQGRAGLYARADAVVNTSDKSIEQAFIALGRALEIRPSRATP